MKASVYKRKSDGRWVGSIDLPRSKGEKRRRKTFYGDTEKEVREKVNIVLYELQVGEYVAPSNDYLVGFLKKYHNICSGYDAWDSSSVRPVKAKWAETTCQLYKMYIDVHFEPYFKDMRIIDIKPSTLDTFYNFKMNDKRKYETRQGDKTVVRTAKPLSINTIIKLHKFLSASFNYAVANDLSKKNPAKGVMLDSPEKFVPNVYDKEKFLKLLDAVYGQDEEIPVILGATLLEAKDLAVSGLSGITPGMLLGMLAAFLSGILAIRLFVKVLRSGKFHYFAYYCWCAGIVALLLTWLN